ncbi:MAG: flagellar biosynthetic protein FliP [Actinomycetia bacterium]|nr:flagellar biosynthetic protein FliP [Actinomycetes bacterium]
MPRTERLLLMLFAAAAFFAPQLIARPASAQVAPSPPSVSAPVIPTPSATAPTTNTTANSNTIGDPNGKASINIDLGGVGANGKQKPGQSVVIILLLTLLAIAPALLVMVTSFTRIVIVLSLTRNALGLTSIPPNQVVIGLSLFLSLFVMFPTIQAMNDTALQPLLDGKITYGKAYDQAQKPLRAFMLKETRKSELDLFIKASRSPKPETREKVSLATLIPAFVLSELKTAFIIGFIIFIPFLIIDLVISSALMSMGMFMLPPVLVSLPFKLMLFVMVDGWALVVRSLITSFH